MAPVLEVMIYTCRAFPTIVVVIHVSKNGIILFVTRLAELHIHIHVNIICSDIKYKLI